MGSVSSHLAGAGRAHRDPIGALCHRQACRESITLADRSATARCPEPRHRTDGQICSCIVHDMRRVGKLLEPRDNQLVLIEA